MKNSFSLAGLTIIFFWLVAGLNGQTAIVETAPRVTEFKFADQPDSPIRLAVAKNTAEAQDLARKLELQENSLDQ